MHSYFQSLLFFVFFALSVLPQAFAAKTTILISDIDDTIKSTKVKNTVASYFAVKLDKNEFAGMRELYEEILKAPESAIFYVSNATEHFFSMCHITIASSWRTQGSHWAT